MRKIVIASFLIICCFHNAEAQKKLSKNEVKNFKKKKKIEKLESALFSGQIRFVADKMLGPTGNRTNARGGILYLKGDKGEFMEFWWIKNTKKVLISSEFKIEELNKIGSFNSEKIELSFTAIIRGEFWSFELTTKPSGKSHLILKNNLSTTIRYDGRVSML